MSRVGAHPRSRGEHFPDDFHIDTDTGSSPLTRGARLHQPPLKDSHRLIPAHAGSTEGALNDFPNTRAHPRSRGEHKRHGPAGGSSGGSSPLTRGALLTRTRVKPRQRAHPRSRGEHAYRKDATMLDQGSSPLTRGALGGEELRYLLAGLIPAHAGSTSWAAYSFRAGGAHPRSRGEHEVAVFASAGFRGSSPLTRGAH